MHGTVPVPQGGASFPADVPVNDFEFADAPDGGDGFAAFSRMLRRFFPGKTAAIIACLTGISERSAYRLVAATSQPSGDTVFRFLRSTEGGRVLDWIMDGCTAPWWLQHLHDRDQAAALRAAGVQLDFFKPE